MIHRYKSKLGPAVLTAAIAATAGGVAVTLTAPVAAGQASAASGGSGTSGESGLHFTSRVVLVDRGTVRANLIGISSDGTFKFRRAAGALSKLAPGKVMLLQGADALLVQKVTRNSQRH